MCLVEGHNNLPVTQNQLKEMEENRERKERSKEGSGRGRKRNNECNNNERKDLVPYQRRLEELLERGGESVCYLEKYMHMPCRNLADNSLSRMLARSSNSTKQHIHIGEVNLNVNIRNILGLGKEE